MAALYQANMQAWKALHPDWKVKLWDTKKCENLINQKFPRMLPLFSKSITIMKADLARMIILLAEGGLYVDLDCIPKMRFEQILVTNNFLPQRHRSAVFKLQEFSASALRTLQQEFPIQTNATFLPTRLANSPLYVSHTNSLMLQRALALSRKRLEWCEQNQWRSDVDWNANDLILYTTGPDVITEATYRWDYTNKVDPTSVIIDSSELYIVELNVGSWKSKNDTRRIRRI